MAEFRYTAKRELVTGHSAGTIYPLDIPLAVSDIRVRAQKDSLTSLSGRQADRLHGYRDEYDIETTPTEDTDVQANIREFLYSVLDGTQFSYFDVDNPSNELTVKLVGTFRERRIQTTQDKFYTFRVRVV